LTQFRLLLVRAIPLVQNSNTTVKVAFANRLIALESSPSILLHDGNLDEAVAGVKMTEIYRQEYSKLVITDLWDNFRLESPQKNIDKGHNNNSNDDDDDDDDDNLDDDNGDGDRVDDGFDIGSYKSSPITIDEANMTRKVKDILIGTDLENLILNTMNMRILTEDEIRQHLVASVTEADRDTCNYTLLPFVKLILEQKIPCYQLDKNNGQPNLGSVDFVTRVLERYIRTCVGKEPKRPAKWTGPAGSCRDNPCTDCHAVYNFLANPKERVGDFHCENFRHLNRTFPDTRGAPYDVKIERDSEPLVWQIVKTDTSFKHGAWRARYEVAMQKVDTLIHAGPLRSYLGNAADDILSLDVGVIEKRLWEAERAQA